MKSDSQTREDVIRELRWDPRILVSRGVSSLTV
jgi:hypothetical protein